MRKETKKAPTIRFRGFTEDWEQRKLGDIADVYDGIHQTPDYTDNGIMFLSVENINTLKSEKYISEEAFIRDYKVYPEKGDILMTRIGDVGTPNVVETTEKVAFYVSLALLKPINVDSYFLCNSILSPFFQNGLKERTLVTAIPQKINKDEIGKVGLYLPTLIDEQREIGAFFQRLNHLITLHQRKFDELKTAKTYFLQNMFPAKGEKVPRIRFHGFTGDWEQRKLGDVTEFIRNGYTYKADCSRNHRYKIARIESISSGKLNIKKLGSSDIINKNYRLKAGDILFSHINSLPYIANTAIYTDNLGEIYHGMNLLNIRTIPQTIKPHFLLYLLKKESSRQWFRTIANPAVNQASISTAEVKKFVFFIPTINEQNKIADFFRNLDNLITLHQHKLNQLKALKKFMLQNLFI